MRRLLLFGLSVCAPLAPALAHTGLGDAAGFSHGVMHPIGGLDHVLAMVAVGVCAAHLRGRALWLAPLTFVSVMAAAGALGSAGLALPYAETGIALSVVALGAAIAFAITLPLAAAMAFVGLFAIFHGYAHGAEMPDSASGLAYGAGFVLATALLHLIGIALGTGVRRLDASNALRVARAGGGLIAMAGVAILAEII